MGSEIKQVAEAAYDQFYDGRAHNPFNNLPGRTRKRWLAIARVALEAAARARGERVVYTCESPYVSINMRQVVETMKQNGVHTLKRGEELVIRKAVRMESEHDIPTTVEGVEKAETYVRVLDMMRERCETHPQWPKRANGTPLDNDIPVRCANVACAMLNAKDSELSRVKAELAAAKMQAVEHQAKYVTMHERHQGLWRENLELKARLAGRGEG